MNEPNIHYHSLRHRERVQKMNRDYHISDAKHIIGVCLGIGLFTLLVLAEVWVIGNFA